MKRIVIALRGVVGSQESESVLQQSKFLERLASLSTVDIIPAAENVKTEELAWLGIDPSSRSISNGVLVASAFKIEPPPKTVCFEMSLLSLDLTTGFLATTTAPNPSETKELQEVMAKLENRSLFPKWGDATTHMLFWLDGSLELGTRNPECIQNKPISVVLPEGDREAKLRMFIDDSINLLLECETNKRRIGEGIAPLSVFWPWGHGFYESYPNLALKSGEIVYYESLDLKLEGLTRLYGYRHGKRTEFGRPLNPDLKRIKTLASERNSMVVLFDHIESAITHHREDQAEQMLKEMEDTLINDVSFMRPLKLTVIATPIEEGNGVSLTFESEHIQNNIVPLDERCLDDKRARRIPLYETMAAALRP